MCMNNSELGNALPHNPAVASPLDGWSMPFPVWAMRRETSLLSLFPSPIFALLNCLWISRRAQFPILGTPKCNQGKRQIGNTQIFLGITTKIMWQSRGVKIASRKSSELTKRSRDFFPRIDRVFISPGSLMGDQSLSCNPLSILPEWAMPLCLEKMDARGIFFFMRHFFSLLLLNKKISSVCNITERVDARRTPHVAWLSA